jgi:hypothetical protein
MEVMAPMDLPVVPWFRPQIFGRREDTGRACSSNAQVGDRGQHFGQFRDGEMVEMITPILVLSLFVYPLVSTYQKLWKITIYNLYKG